MFSLLSIFLLSAAPVQDNEAEKLFRAMEKKIKAANAAQITFEIELRAIKGREEDSKLKARVSRANGSLLLTKDNKARLWVSGEYVGMEMVSNGKKMKLAFAEGDPRSIDRAKAKPTPSHLHGMLWTLVSRGGVAATTLALPLLLKSGLAEAEFDPDAEESRLTVYGFKAGRAEKVGGRAARVIHYRWGKGDGCPDDLAFTLWLDGETLLPLKKVYTIKNENLHITETYTEFKLDPRTDAGAFALVPAAGNAAEKFLRAVEAKIKAARAVQVTFDIQTKTKDQEGKLKGTLLFTGDNKARLKLRARK